MTATLIAVPTTVGEVLTAAADLINRYDLHKGDYWPGAARDEIWKEQPLCAAGAIRVAAGHDVPLYVRTRSAFADWLVLNGYTGRCVLDDLDVTDAVETIAAWSDNPARTAAQVPAALRACAALDSAEATP